MRRWLPIVILIGTVTVSGCAAMQGPLRVLLRPTAWWEAGQAAAVSQRARDLETRAELAMALDHWRLVERIAADPAQAAKAVVRLESQIAQAARLHYQNGLGQLARKEMTAARNHFLAALRLDPAFEPALKQIQASFSPFPLAVYITGPGEDPAAVAKTFFGDEEQSHVVAWFNDLTDDAALQPGTLLVLPRLETKTQTKATKKEQPDPLSQAAARLAANDPDGALTLAKQADAADSRLQLLIDTIHLHQAMARTEAGQLEAAQQALSMVPEGVDGRKAAEAALEAALQRRQVDADIAMARTHFEGGRYRQSLDLLEALVLNAPERVEALDWAAEARYRLALAHADQRRFLEARAVLEKADQAHEGSAVLKETVRVRLVEMGQAHYRKGVKHFINEDLKSAISAWEAALIYDPDHAKARENIENARRLLEKLEAMP